MSEKKHELFSVGDRVVCNERGRSAQVCIPRKDDLLGCTCWPVEEIIDVASPPGIHPQRLDLGEGYPFGPVSAAFYSKCGGDCGRR